MSDYITRKDYPEIHALLRYINPRLKKHKAVICTTDSVTPIGTYWDGGSINDYVAFNIDTKTSSAVPAPTAPIQFGGGKPKAYALTDNVIVVKFGTFCGRTAAPTIYATPNALTALKY